MNEANFEHDGDPNTDRDVAAQAADRRPLKSREQRVWQRLAGGLASAGVSANTISVLGMFAGLAAGACLAGTAWTASGTATRLLWLGGALLVQARLLANMLDGMVALQRGEASPIGELYNEVPDRVSDAAILLGLGYAAGSSPTLGWSAALVAFFVAYVRATGKNAGVLGVFHGPFGKPHRMFAVTVAAIAMAALPWSWTHEYVTVELSRSDGDTGEILERCVHYGLPAATLLLLTLGGLFTAWRRLRIITQTLRTATP